MLVFAAKTVLSIGEDEIYAHQHELVRPFHLDGANRSAARVLPLLLLPVAARLRSIIDKSNEKVIFKRVIIATLNLAQAAANEVRLYLARSLDHLWNTPCIESGICHHEVGLRIAIDTMRDCVIGGRASSSGQRNAIIFWKTRLQRLCSHWTSNIRQRSSTMLKEANEILAGVTDDSILVDRLDGAIRALAPAVIADNCVSKHARELLMTLLSVQRRVLLTHDDNYVRRGSTLISARALLTLATQNDDELLYAHIDAYAEGSTRLSTLLHWSGSERISQKRVAEGSTRLSTLLQALSAAAEETPSRATAALRVWPKVVSRVLELSDLGRIPSQDRHYRDMELATLIPNITSDFAYMYREVEDEPISWLEPLELQSTVEAWLVPAAGNPQCADQLIEFIRKLTLNNQARIGLPWVAKLVLADPDHIARYLWVETVVDWLIEVRTAVTDADLQALWQQVVDDLVVAGVSKLAPYSD